jgi:hypothetical protein
MFASHSNKRLVDFRYKVHSRHISSLYTQEKCVDLEVGVSTVFTENGWSCVITVVETATGSFRFLIDESNAVRFTRNIATFSNIESEWNPTMEAHQFAHGVMEKSFNPVYGTTDPDHGLRIQPHRVFNYGRVIQVSHITNTFIVFGGEENNTLQITVTGINWKITPVASKPQSMPYAATQHHKSRFEMLDDGDQDVRMVVQSKTPPRRIAYNYDECESNAMTVYGGPGDVDKLVGKRVAEVAATIKSDLIATLGVFNTELVRQGGAIAEQKKSFGDYMVCTDGRVQALSVDVKAASAESDARHKEYMEHRAKDAAERAEAAKAASDSADARHKEYMEHRAKEASDRAKAEEAAEAKRASDTDRIQGMLAQMMQKVGELSSSQVRGYNCGGDGTSKAVEKSTPPPPKESERSRSPEERRKRRPSTELVTFQDRVDIHYKRILAEHEAKRLQSRRPGNDSDDCRSYKGDATCRGYEDD